MLHFGVETASYNWQMAETLNLEQIKGALTELGWTQRKLAGAIGVSPQTITNWMSAKDFHARLPC